MVAIDIPHGRFALSGHKDTYYYSIFKKRAGIKKNIFTYKLLLIQHVT